MDKTIDKIFRLLGSRTFFYFILALFFLEAAWTALSFRYPLPFDEYYHFGLIQFYSHHINPILTSQPLSADIYGDIVHSPSYLFHYLLSFPYRLIEAVFSSVTAQVVALRFINISIFIGGIFAFRKVFMQAKLSRAGTNLVFLFFALLPSTSFLAAHINYDSLLLLGTALSIYLCQKIVMEKRRLEFKLISLLLVINLLVSLVKFSFLPVFLAEAVYMGWIFYARGKDYRKSLAETFGKTSRNTKLLLALLLVISSFLFLQRIGINVIKYGKPLPYCQQVLSVSRCEHNPTFNNAQHAKQKSASLKVPSDPTLYLPEWLISMEAGYFVTGANTSDGHIGTAPPSPILRYGFGLLVFIGMILSIYYWRDIRRNTAFKLYLTIIIIYVAALWLQNYHEYLRLKSVIAVNARYLFPVLLLMLVIIQTAYSMALKNRQGLKLILVTAIILTFTQGGGVLNSVVSAKPTWYWQRPKVINTNLRIKKIVDRFEFYR